MLPSISRPNYQIKKLFKTACRHHRIFLFTKNIGNGFSDGQKDSDPKFICTKTKLVPKLIHIETPDPEIWLKGISLQYFAAFVLGFLCWVVLGSAFQTFDLSISNLVIFLSLTKINKKVKVGFTNYITKWNNKYSEWVCILEQFKSQV